MCLQDGDPRIAALAHLFFEELSNKVTKVRAIHKQTQVQGVPCANSQGKQIVKGCACGSCRFGAPLHLSRFANIC